MRPTKTNHLQPMLLAVTMTILIATTSAFVQGGGNDEILGNVTLASSSLMPSPSPSVGEIVQSVIH